MPSGPIPVPTVAVMRRRVEKTLIDANAALITAPDHAGAGTLVAAMDQAHAALAANVDAPALVHVLADLFDRLTAFEKTE